MVTAGKRRGRRKVEVDQRPVGSIHKDPTRTLMLRKAFFAAISKRFMKLKGEINQLVVGEDALGMKRANRVVNVRWAFRNSGEKLREFQKWLALQIDATLLDVAAEEAYYEAYVAQGYAKGAGRSFEQVMAKKPRWGPGEGQFYAGAKSQFLAESFTSPVATEKVKLIAGRVFTDLKDITDTMSTGISRALTDGLVKGDSPRTVATKMNKQVDLGRARSLRIARTETVRAHAEGQLDALERLGVDKIGVAVEWSTSKMGVTRAGYPSPCELCAPLQGIVMSIKEARGLLPRHPNCMCSYIPANVGEDRAQKKSQSEVRKAVRSSVRAEKGTGPLAKKMKRSDWVGADLKPNKRRPKPLTNASWASRPSMVHNLARRSRLTFNHPGDHDQSVHDPRGGGGGMTEKEAKAKFPEVAHMLNGSDVKETVGTKKEAHTKAKNLRSEGVFGGVVKNPTGSRKGGDQYLVTVPAGTVSST